MSRRPKLYYDRRPMWVAWGLITTVMVACGKDSPKPTVAASTPTETPTVVPTGGLSPAASGPVTPVGPRVATYDEAASVFKSGNYQEAKTLFETYVGTKPENPWGHYMLGLSAWKSGDFKTAERAFDRAIGLDATHVKSYLGSARVLLDLKREHEAIERIEQALELDSTSADGLRLLARATSQTGEIETAIEIYRKVLVQDDKDFWAMNNLGALYLDQGQPESAIGPLARAVELKGTAPVFQNNLGMALERTGHFTAAKDAYQAAVKADSTYGKAVKNLERLAAMVIDPNDTSAGFVKDQADTFRLLIQMWRDR